ncbi:MAG: DUF2793 domain-containing protein [Erythrobacter sp.]|nr:DUF2793 domain-containing protein [Erythrobacter sp.]
MPGGQAQKEFFVNQALAILDTLHARTVIASQPASPPASDDGECFRVTAPATGAWEGCEGHLAIQIGGDWHFGVPREGMQVFDIEADTSLFFKVGWQAAIRPANPANGTTIDTEARAAIEQLINVLHDFGILPPSSA